MKYPIYIQCLECQNRFRIERLEPVTTVGVPRICPVCGSTNVRSGVDTDSDYWYSMASSFGYEPNEKSAHLIRNLFNLWDSREYTSFRSFVEAMKE